MPSTQLRNRPAGGIAEFWNGIARHGMSLNRSNGSAILRRRLKSAISRTLPQRDMFYLQMSCSICSDVSCFVKKRRANRDNIATEYRDNIATE